MARKKNSPNMSEAVRELLSQNPQLTAKQVMEALAGKGMTVKPNLVYFVMGKMRAGKLRRRKVARAAQAATTDGSHADALTLIREIKALAMRTGGIGKLKALVDVLAE